MHRGGASRIGGRLMVAACAALLLVAGGAAAESTVQEEPAPEAPSERIARQLEEITRDGRSVTEVSPPPAVTAEGWIVHDVAANEPIAAQDAATPRPIASLAKLMTALVVVERMELDETVTIPAAVNDLNADAARMDARAGEKWPARDLLLAMLAHSANDAAIALARHVGDGDEAAFVELMNARARELGLADTEFASPTGLDLTGEPSVSTPIDLVMLAEAALEHEAIRAAVAEPRVELRRPGGSETITLPNRNPLLGAYPGVDGVKTGFTEAAGYMLVVHHLDAGTAGDVMVVTFSSESEATRVSDARRLLDWARTLRVELRVVEGGAPYGSVPVQRSDADVSLFACDDLVVHARIGQLVHTEVVVPRSIAAPVRAGDEIGQLRLRLGSAGEGDGDARLPETVPLCSGDDVRRLGRIDRLRDYAGDYRDAWQRGIEEVEDGWSFLRERVA